MEPKASESRVAVGALKRALQAEGVVRRAGPPPTGLTEAQWADLVRLLKDAPRLAAHLTDFVEGRGPWPQSLAFHMPDVALWVAERHPEAAAFLPDPKRFVDPLPTRQARGLPPKSKAFDPGPAGQLRVGALALEALGGLAALKAWVEAWRMGHAERQGRLPPPLHLLPEGAWRDNEIELHWAGQVLGSLALERASVAVLAPPERDLAELPGGVPGAGPGGRPMLWRPEEEQRALRQDHWWVMKPRQLVGAWLEAFVRSGVLPSESHLLRADAPDEGWAPPTEANAKGEVPNGWIKPPAASFLDLRRRQLEAALAATGVALDDRVELFGLGMAIPPGPHPDYLGQEALRPGPFDLRLRRMLLKQALGPTRRQDAAWEAWALVPQLAWRKLAPWAAERGGLLEVAAPDGPTHEAIAEALRPQAQGLWTAPLQGEAWQAIRASAKQALQGLNPPLLWVPAGWRPQLGPLLAGLLPGMLLVSDEDLPPGVRFQAVADWRWSG